MTYDALFLGVGDNGVSAAEVLVEEPGGQNAGEARLHVGAFLPVVRAAGGVVGENHDVLV